MSSDLTKELYVLEDFSNLNFSVDAKINIPILQPAAGS